MSQLNHRTIVALLFVAQLLWASGAFAGGIRYLAWNGHEASATIETSAGVQHVRLGDAVPGYGSVVALDESLLVVRRVLSAAERDRLADGGLTDYVAERVEVVREDLAFQGIPVRPSTVNP